MRLRPLRQVALARVSFGFAARALASPALYESPLGEAPKPGRGGLTLCGERGEISPRAWRVRGVPRTSVERRASAATGRGEAARALKIVEGPPCLVIERRAGGGETPATRVALTYPGEAQELAPRFTPEQTRRAISP